MVFSVTKRSNICKGQCIFVFAKSMGRKIGKNISKIFSSKYSQNLTDHDKQSSADALKTASKWAIQETAYATDDLIRNIADRITKVSKNSPRNNSEENIEHDREIHREGYVSP